MKEIKQYRPIKTDLISCPYCGHTKRKDEPTQFCPNCNWFIKGGYKPNGGDKHGKRT
ncbi:MAG: hypothetical protein PVF58_14055 [Candidatus Methanofastidiosia archaeon]